MFAETLFIPQFNFSDNSQFVELAQCKAQVTIDGDVFDFPASARLRLLPYPQISFCVDDVSKMDIKILKLMTTEHDSFDYRIIEPFELSGVTTNFGTVGAGLEWSPPSKPVHVRGNKTTKINAIVFHLYNFPQIVGTRYSSETVDRTEYRIHFLDLLSEKWKITIKSLSE